MINPSRSNRGKCPKVRVRVRGCPVHSTSSKFGIYRTWCGKSFVYVSGGQQLTPGEHDNKVTNLQQVTVSSGYAQTKLASELLAKKVAVSRSGPHHRFFIIKPSYIIGWVGDGVVNTTDYLWRLVAGAIEVNSYNGDKLDNFVYLFIRILFLNFQLKMKLKERKLPRF